MGAVYEAQHVDLNKRVALKTIHREVARNAEARARFVREGHVASRIRHAHVVDVTDVGVQDGVPYLVMEYFEGHDLATKLEREGPITVEALTDTMLPVLAAIGAAHDENVVHRDLKPENIFLAHTKQGAVIPKVLDFGISKLADGISTALTGTGSLLGTPSYMAPEQAQGRRDLGAPCDQYALGVIFYECLTGHLPFQEDSLYALLLAIGAGTFPAPRELRPEIPEAFEAIVLRAMARDPDDRFESVYAFGRTVLAFASSQARANWSSVFNEDRISATALVQSPDPGRASRPRASSTLGQSAREVDSISVPKSVKRRRSLALAGGFVVAGAAIMFFSMRNSGAPTESAPPVPPAAHARPATPAPTFQVATTVFPVTAQIEIDGAPAGIGSVSRSFEQNGIAHSLRGSAPGFEPMTVVFTDISAPATITLSPIAPIPTPTPAPDPMATAAGRRGHTARHGRNARHGHAANPGGVAPSPGPPATTEAPAPRRPVVNEAPILE